MLRAKFLLVADRLHYIGRFAVFLEDNISLLPSCCCWLLLSITAMIHFTTSFLVCSHTPPRTPTLPLPHFRFGVVLYGKQARCSLSGLKWASSPWRAKGQSSTIPVSYSSRASSDMTLQKTSHRSHVKNVISMSPSFLTCRLASGASRRRCGQCCLFPWAICDV